LTGATGIIGYFIAQLTEGASYEEAIRYGNAAGALAVTKFGTQGSIPSKVEVDEFLSK